MFSTWSNSQNKVPLTARRDNTFGRASGDAPSGYLGSRWQVIAPQNQGVGHQRQGKSRKRVVGGRGGNGLLEKRFNWVSGYGPSVQERPW